MKFLFISQYFYPENFRGNDIAFELAKDHEVHVITGIPNYPKGKFYKGYGYFKKRSEVIDGVKVTRIPLIPRGNNSLMLILNYFTFMLNACIYILFHAISHKYDKILVQQLSPVMMSMPAVLYKKLRKTPLYTWVLDLWPESLQAAGGIHNKFILNFFDLFVRSEYKNSDVILMSSNSFRASILKYGDYSNKLVYFPQWAEDSFFNSDTDLHLDIPEGFNIVFAGNVGESQDFDNVMKAALLTKESKHIHWVIVGDGRRLSWVRSFVKENDLDDTVYIMGRYPVDAMPYFFKRATVMLVSLKDEYIFSLTSPAKIQAYMSASKPIVAMLNGEGADVVNKADCGFTVKAGDAVSLAKLVQNLSQLSPIELEDKGNNGYSYYSQNFTKIKAMTNLKNILNRD